MINKDKKKKKKKNQILTVLEFSVHVIALASVSLNERMSSVRAHIAKDVVDNARKVRRQLWDGLSCIDLASSGSFR